MEEKKSKKKIEETKQKAEEIKILKLRNKESIVEKQNVLFKIAYVLFPRIVKKKNFLGL